MVPDNQISVAEKKQIKEGDMLVYVHSMVQSAFDKLYKKETNSYKTRSEAYDIECHGNSGCDDDHRHLIITVVIPKDINFI